MGNSTQIAKQVKLGRGYAQALRAIKERIQRTRVRMALTANSALVLLYWDIGRTILVRQERLGWGARVIDRLAEDLRRAFPDMKGISPRNLKYMRAFASAWSKRAIVQRSVAQLPWRHHIALLEKLRHTPDRMWYARKALEHGWSQNILVIQIQRRARERQGNALTNFADALPPRESDMAEQVFKDPYLFDFLGTADLRRERDVEQALVDHIQSFLLELGTGFAFVGRQVSLVVGDQDFVIDLLFYHLVLRCYVVVELKAVPFDPAFVGQLNLYLSAVDDGLRHSADQPTIGLLLCRDKNRVVVEYALRDVKKPIGVAGWSLTESLPSVEEIAAEFSVKRRHPRAR